MPTFRTAALAALYAATALAAATAQAQVYRSVGPDGKVTFTDRPPVDGKATPAATLPLGGGAAANLPAEVRRAAGQYPVTLYSSSDCGPCDQARAMLQRRGIPFSEKTINTPQDAAALQRVSGGNSLPFATIGGQHLNGFAEGEWSQFLDAAGYPKTSQLPASYRNPPATPLVAVQLPPPQAPAAPQGGSAQAAPAPAPAPAESTGSNPAGIRF
ncbi:glutaredoxin family protein [Ramlibacter sp. USB13]|uniref:Glutaredoxin family protein n=1 Tax=Ramlibacter cellulosilyticus TaxID=2764187 RepID=A0A923MTW1_9BURK|nr:glutaredoxin family protein [Ramlibacter cellulosilyticus]MBC5783682.1 glutaredoxin family protein [Ramlibacter cellulosilyticus]